MNALLLSEIHLRQLASSQGDLPLAANGVVRYVWESRFGPMLIEVKDGTAYAKGKSVEPSEFTTPVRASEL